jgi:hypothetical protein
MQARYDRRALRLGGVPNGLRLEQVMVPTVDDDYVDRGFCEPLGGGEAPKASADNDDTGA